MLDRIGGFEQCRGIHFKVLAAVKVTQEADAAEKIADEAFKRYGAYPVSVDFDTGGREKFEFNRTGDVRGIPEHVVKTENHACVRQELVLYGVNRMEWLVPASGKTLHCVESAAAAFASKTDAPHPYLIESEHHPWQ